LLGIRDPAKNSRVCGEMNMRLQAVWVSVNEILQEGDGSFEVLF
jgi:hypothetical protein